MSDQVNVGMVGSGWMGSTLLARLAARSDVRVVGLHQQNHERAEKALKALALEGVPVFDDFQTLLNVSQLDAVVLASPNSSHGEQSIAAMEAGKHVFCEKPAATRYDQCLKQIALEQAHEHLITFVDYILYFDSMEQRLREMTASGAFGKLTQVQVNYRHPINISGHKQWKLSKQTMGDAIGMGINHSLSVILLLMRSQAKPVSVFATSMPAQVRPFEAKPIWNILIRFDDGATGFCFGNIDSSNGYDAYHNFSGTQGAFIFDSQLDRPQKIRMWSNALTEGKWVYPLDAERCRSEGIEPWPMETTTPDSGDVIEHQTGACIDHFIECIKTRTPSPLSFANAAAIMEIGWAAQMSAVLQRPIDLPLNQNEAARFFAANDGMAPNAGKSV